MSGKLKVSFNSPQCGWMSIGFEDSEGEFHTTTAHAPHAEALPELMRILTAIMGARLGADEYLIKWNRDPEEFDLRFLRDGRDLVLEIYQFPTDERAESTRELVFTHHGTVREVCEAFAATFEQLYADRDTDEFDFNWRSAFPVREFEEFKERMEG